MTLQKDPEGSERRVLHQFVDFSGKRVIEIGCGEGRLTWQYAKRNRMTAGVDLDRASLRIAALDRPAELNNRAHFACADSQSLPFSNEAFDIAILAWSL